jgi:hypothetical protein
LADDKEVQNLITSTKPQTSSTPAGVALVFGNQCLTSETPTPAEEQVALMDNEAYISGINNFIDNANLNDVVNSRLLTIFTTTNPLSS